MSEDKSVHRAGSLTPLTYILTNSLEADDKLEKKKNVSGALEAQVEGILLSPIRFQVLRQSGSAKESGPRRYRWDLLPSVYFGIAFVPVNHNQKNRKCIQNS